MQPHYHRTCQKRGGKRKEEYGSGIVLTHHRYISFQSPGTLHKDVGGAGTKVSGKTVGGVGTATLTTLSSINNTSNTSRNKNNPVSQEVSRIDRVIFRSTPPVIHIFTIFIFPSERFDIDFIYYWTIRNFNIFRFTILIYHKKIYPWKDRSIDRWFRMNFYDLIFNLKSWIFSLLSF